MTERSADRTYSPPDEGRGSPPSDRVRVRRDTKHRGRYDSASVHAVVDATPFCHLAYILGGHPVAIPTIQVRIEDHLYLHASSGSRIGLSAGQPWPVSVSVTLIDGLVLARSGFHHSINYRSVVVIGDALLVTDPAERLEALNATVDKVVPGRSSEVRPPTDRELEATAVAKLSLAEASVKVRTGPPVDEPADLGLDIWAGVLPRSETWGPPLASPDLPAGVAVSSAVRHMIASTTPR